MPKTKRERLEKEWLTPTEAFERYGITTEHITGWINHQDEDKRLPATNIANTSNRPRWRIKIADLEAFLAKRSNVQAIAKKATRRPRRKSGRQYV